MGLNGNNWRTPPKPQEIEISIFGPGFGECVVIHFGYGDWGVVDSCMDPESKRPAALDYLGALQVEVPKAVRIILATHWHDDHMQGMGLIYKAAKSSIFACTEAVRHQDFTEILSAWRGTRSMLGGSGLDELHSILIELKSRSANTNYPSPKLASVNKTIWQRRTPAFATMCALSPSNAAILASMERLRELEPSRSKERRRIPNLSPNDASVVVRVCVAEHRVLLGADLEVRKDQGFGWGAILNEASTEEERHQFFKIPHHGSPTAHHDEVWNQMLISEPWTATTPFVFGSVRLPSMDDCRRILSRTSEAYLTAPPQPTKFHDSDRTVEKTVTDATLNVHFVPGRYGHVRMRKMIQENVLSPWNVELFGNAIKMQELVA